LETRFNNANLSGANFAHAILAEASFHGANILNADFTGAVISSDTSFQAALNGSLLFRVISFAYLNNWSRAKII
jgi:uncharacterized protein YjbI with pentapeptide repeats